MESTYFVGHAKAKRKHIYMLFKVKRWNVQLNYIFDPLIEYYDDSDDINDAAQAKRATQMFTVSALLECLPSSRQQYVNLIHHALTPMDIYSTFFRATPTVPGQQRRAELDEVCRRIMIDLPGGAPVHLIDEWLSMLQYTRHYFGKTPGVAEREKFYKEFFLKFLLVYGFSVRQLSLTGQSRCRFHLNDKLTNVLRDMWNPVEDVTSQPDLFIVRCTRDQHGRTKPELMAVVEVKAPRKIGQWGPMDDDSVKEKKEMKEEAMTRNKSDEADTANEAVVSSSGYAAATAVDDEEEDDSDVEDVGEPTVSASSVYCYPTANEKLIMESYVPQLLGEMVCNFHQDSVFQEALFKKSPYRLGVVVIGFKVQFVGMRFSKKHNEAGDDTSNLCPERVILDKTLETQLFFSKPLDILKMDERKSIIDILCAAEALWSDGLG